MDSSAPYIRDRAYTESSYASGSTAIPPTLFNSGLDLGKSDDGFGSMFENFGRRKSQIAPLDSGSLVALRTASPVSGIKPFPDRKYADSSRSECLPAKPILAAVQPRA